MDSECAPLDQPSLLDASVASPSIQIITLVTTLPLLPAECGRQRTPAQPGRRCSTMKALIRSAPSLSIRKIRWLCGSALVRTTASEVFLTATVFTNQRTAVAPGETLV